MPSAKQLWLDSPRAYLGYDRKENIILKQKCSKVCSHRKVTKDS